MQLQPRVNALLVVFMSVRKEVMHNYTIIIILLTLPRVIRELLGGTMQTYRKRHPQHSVLQEQMRGWSVLLRGNDIVRHIFMSNR